ncbi:MAG: sensor histidine kinase [Candidatus Thorarchaeota archaeon]
MSAKRTEKRVRVRQIAFPLIFLIIALSIALVYTHIFEFREAGLDGLAFYFALFSTSFTILILFQRFVDSKRLHIPMSLGWGLVFLGTFEKFVNDFTDTIGLENENFFSAVIFVGLLFVAFGLYFWTKQMWDNQRVRSQQHKIIELYTSLMSHDAGNDLQAILGYIEAALLVPEGCSPRTLELLEAAQAAALRMSSLIKAFKPDVSDAENRLIAILEISAHQAVKAHLGLTIDIEADDETQNIQVVGGSMLQMAFANLFRNAAQYAGEKPTVSIKVSKEDTNAVIVVSDDGPGIGQEFKEKLFERGGSGDGHGFGLYLTRQIVSACEGSIELMDSEKGANFRIILPFEP